MDRDRRWDRIQRAYDLLVHGRAPRPGGDGARGRARRPTRAARPTSSSSRRWWGRRRRSAPAATACSRFNFRPDRMREITRALAEPGFAELDRGGAQPVAHYATMTEYEEGWPYPVAFPPERPAGHARRSARRRAAWRSCTSPRPRSTPTSPTSSTAARRTPWPARRASWCRRRGTSPTYDHKPEMSAVGVAEAFVRHWRGGVAELRGRQLRQPGHGRPHRRHPRRGAAGIETVDGCLGRGRRGRARGRRCAA